MEAQPQRGSPAAAYPRWVLLEQYLEIKVVDNSSACSPTTTGDTNTLAAARTSAGHPIQVSLRLAEPPALSRVLVRIPAGLEEEKSKVLAAHGDSVLIQLRIREAHQRDHTSEHFVYNAGAAAAAEPQPPSLWLLPPCYEEAYFSDSDLVSRELSDTATGLLRRRGDGDGDGDGELVVVEISDYGTPGAGMGEALMLRSDEWEWKCYRFKISEDWGSLAWLDAVVVPVDDRLLCWVNLNRGVMLVDVFMETPTMRYVRLPTAPRGSGILSRNVCATTAGGGAGGALRFVNVLGRCCCGAAAASCDCEHARHAYTIQTWTMRIGHGGGGGGGMEWVLDGMMDATELWELDAYKGLGLPCDTPVDRPIVSTDEPEVICFRLRDTKCHSSGMIWQVMVDMRSKTVRSVSRHQEELGYCYARDKLIPSKVSCFFNSYYPSSGTSDDDEAATTLACTMSKIDIIERPRPPSVVTDEQSEIFQTLHEIRGYGLCATDEVKAYRILCDDNGRRLRSLLRLPKNLRKNWLMIEIKYNQD